MGGTLNLLIGFTSWVGVILLGEQLYLLRQDMNDKNIIILSPCHYVCLQLPC